MGHPRIGRLGAKPEVSSGRPVPGSAALAATILLAAAPGSASLPFRDVTAGSGVDVAHANGATGEKQYKEVIGSGVCLLDADGDGRLDLYFVSSLGSNRLYRNLGALRFEDVTDVAGVADVAGYGMGAVAADIDNDGDDDLFVTNYGPNRLFRNRGDGTFEELGDAAGVDDARWGAGAAFLDADLDGVLDLYLVNYVQQAEPDTNECLGARGALRLYCHPRLYPRETDVFYRGLGGARFEDVTEAAGLAGFAGRGLGVVAADLDADGLTDLYVANDLDPNFLFRNRGDGTFEEIGTIAGCAYSEDGREESAMGIAVGDYDNDGAFDLFVTNFQNESNTLYHNEGGALFFDRSATSGLGPGSVPWLGWGTGFFDFDLDGWLDLFVVNGHTDSDIEQVDQLATWKQPDQLHENRRDGTFELVTSEEAPDVAVRRAGRGVAFGDLDDDGDVDLVISNQRAKATILENAAETGRHWIGFELDGGDAMNRDAIGAIVEVRTADLVQVREVRAGGSYLSGNDLRLVFGLGDQDHVDEVILRFPGGVQRLDPMVVDRYHRVSVGSR